MRAIQLFRKLDPAAWGGTESAMQRLFEGLRAQGVTPVIYSPRLDPEVALKDPFVQSGFTVHRFKAFVPVLGMSSERKRQLVAVGGNLMSFDLFTSLWRESDISIIHSHALGRIGAIGRSIARKRGIPFVVTIHGGVLDLPEKVKESFNAPIKDGFEWGKLFSLIFQSHRLLSDADAVLTCNHREAELLRERHPDKRIIVQPHAVPVEMYKPNHKADALAAWPMISNRQVLLSLGRIDPIKNQAWLLDQMPAILKRHPQALLVLAGPCTDEPYGRMVNSHIRELGLENHVLLTGGLAQGDPRLIGLLQCATTLVLPSVSETFGLVILEGWAAGTMVISSRTSGGSGMIDHGRNGLIFDLDNPAGLQEAVDITLSNESRRREMIALGAEKAQTGYSLEAVAAQVRSVYEELLAGGSKVREKANQCAT